MIYVRWFGLILGIAATLVCVHGISPASAAAITYTFDPDTSFTFPSGATGNLIGTFTIDPPGITLSAEDVVIEGPGPEAGTYKPRENDGGEALVYASASALLLVEFGSNLNSAQHSFLEGADWTPFAPGAPSFASHVTGGASVPEPSAWAMMLLGFAGLGFAGWRGQRRTAGPAA